MIPKSFLLRTDQVIEWLIENLQGGIAHSLAVNVCIGH
jgi:type IV secretory pathway VirB2 component (pilin)